jgi:putative phosphoesterase
VRFTDVNDTTSMKILLLADIHANWPALSAIDESFDVCLFLGDAVDYATDPVPCIEWIRENASYCVRGNHDHSVAQRVAVRPRGTFRQMAAAMRERHFEVLNDEHLTWLAQMPVTQHLTIGDHSFLLVHATPRDPMDEYLSSVREEWEQRLKHVNVDFVCAGHTHIPMNLKLHSTQVINPGSVGQPRDGDARAAYAIIEDGQVEFRRVEYDIDRTLHHMAECGIEQSVIRKAGTILRSGGNPAVDSGANA